jgi:hexosaminidase
VTKAKDLLAAQPSIIILPQTPVTENEPTIAMRTIWMVPVAIVLMISPTREQELHPLPLMPWPAQVKVSPSPGYLVVDTSFAVGLDSHADGRLRKTVAMFLNDLRRHTGMLPLDFSITTSEKAQIAIHCERPSKEMPELGEDESYRLEVTPSGAELSAPTTLGVMRGLQTFLQLIETTPQGFALPTVWIEDKPRFPWRGLMIDSGRHFIPVDVIKRNLDAMAAVKLNVLHWHLSENQGFRVESKLFPKLQGMGSDGLFYTQDQVRGIIAYARDRGIRVVPEFDMPGHSTAWFVGYPELASAPGPYSVERKWGVFDPAMDPTRESTYKFLDEFIGEMAALFPDQFFHIGGDEVNGKQWNANPEIQHFIRAHGLKDNAGLQAYFNTRVQKLVAKHGKTMEGWDEILRPNLPKSIVIQSWRGQKSLADAAQLGYRGLLSYGYYIDLMNSAASHYLVDPLADAAANLSSADTQKILGGEACMWAEYVSAENIDSRIWPRTAAIAERLWSPQNVTDVHSMYERLDHVNDWLDAYGVTHNTNYDVMLRRIAGTDDISALRSLVDVIEPVKGYSRENLAASEPTALAPLNRVVDAARPESAVARRFSALVREFVSGHVKPGTEPQIRALLSEWRDNQEMLRPVAENSALLQEILPVSHDLSALGASGLQALDYLDRGEKAPDDWKTQQLAIVQQAFEPKAQVLLMVAPAVQKLIQASAGEKPTDLPIPKKALE